MFYILSQIKNKLAFNLIQDIFLPLGFCLHVHIFSDAMYEFIWKVFQIESIVMKNYWVNVWFRVLYNISNLLQYTQVLIGFVLCKKASNLPLTCLPTLISDSLF